MKPAMEYEAFADKTCILPDVIVKTVLEQRQCMLSEEDRNYFIEHSEKWVRWLYVNNPTWKRKLNSKGNGRRDYVYMFVNHWCDSFLKNPMIYKERHPMSSLDCNEELKVVSMTLEMLYAVQNGNQDT